MQRAYDRGKDASPTKEDPRKQVAWVKEEAVSALESFERQTEKALKNQRLTFQRAATEYEQEARDVVQVEVAQAKKESQHSAERKLHMEFEEQTRIGQLSLSTAQQQLQQKAVAQLSLAEEHAQRQAIAAVSLESE